MIFIGIDPGKSGALAIINQPSGKAVAAPFSPDEYREALEMVSTQKCFCVVERVSAMPGQGIVGMFNFGENFGYIQGLLSAYRIPYELTRPQTWKKVMGVTSDKNTSIAVCKRLFPDVSLKRTDRCKVEHDGMAEALLMAEYARRQYIRRG